MHRRLEAVYGPLYLAGPWLAFDRGWGSSYCQPDGLLFLPDRGRIVICEAKLLHTPAAVGQTMRYRRVVQALFPRWELAILEVVRFYKGEGVDRFNIPVRMVLRPEAADPKIFCVMILGKY